MDILYILHKFFNTLRLHFRTLNILNVPTILWRTLRAVQRGSLGRSLGGLLLIWVVGGHSGVWGSWSDASFLHLLKLFHLFSLFHLELFSRYLLTQLLSITKFVLFRKHCITIIKFNKQKTIT